MNEVILMISEWPDGTELKEDQINNFKSAYKLYEILFKAYKENPPEGVDKPFWKNRVIQAFNGQVYFNLPQRYQELYTGRISKNANAQKKKTPTKEHFHPRRPWVKWRLFDIPKKVTLKIFFKLYCEEGGKYHKTTKEENARLETWYHDKGDPNPTKKIWEQAYRETKVILMDDPKIKEAAEKKRKAAEKKATKKKKKAAAEKKATKKKAPKKKATLGTNSNPYPTKAAAEKGRKTGTVWYCYRGNRKNLKSMKKK